MQSGQGRVWPYSMGGAALAFGLLSVTQWGQYEGGDAVVVLGLPALMAGGLVGAWLGGLLVDKRRVGADSRCGGDPALSAGCRDRLPAMGIDVAFFAAPDDRAAVEAERRTGGPLGWPEVTGRRKTGWFRKEPVLTELGPAFNGFAARGFDPVVNMGALEELLTGRDFETILEDPRSGGSPAKDDGTPEGYGVITLTDSLRDALATAEDSRLAEVVGPWSRTEELEQPGWEDVAEAEHLEFLRALRDLARSAKGAGHRLYCYFSL